MAHDIVQLFVYKHIYGSMGEAPRLNHPELRVRACAAVRVGGIAGSARTRARGDAGRGRSRARRRNSNGAWLPGRRRCRTRPTTGRT